MKIILPKDIVKLGACKAKTALKSFRLSKEHYRLIVPKEVRELFPDLGLDMFVSKSERSVYISFGLKQQTQFGMNYRNGYVGCKALFEWLNNAELPVFDNYQYDDYQIDKKKKIVKIKLERK